MNTGSQRRGHVKAQSAVDFLVMSVVNVVIEAQGSALMQLSQRQTTAQKVAEQSHVLHRLGDDFRVAFGGDDFSKGHLVLADLDGIQLGVFAQ